MQTKIKEIIMNNRVFPLIVLLTGLVLLIPLIVMQFSNEVNWNLFDFLVAGILLLGTGFLFVFLARKMPKRKITIAIILTLTFLYI